MNGLGLVLGGILVYHDGMLALKSMSVRSNTTPTSPRQKAVMPSRMRPAISPGGSATSRSPGGSAVPGAALTVFGHGRGTGDDVEQDGAGHGGEQADEIQDAELSPVRAYEIRDERMLIDSVSQVTTCSSRVAISFRMSLARSWVNFTKSSARSRNTVIRSDRAVLSRLLGSLKESTTDSSACLIWPGRSAKSFSRVAVAVTMKFSKAWVIGPGSKDAPSATAEPPPTVAPAEFSVTFWCIQVHWLALLLPPWL